MFNLADFVSVAVVADDLGCSHETVRRWIRQGRVSSADVEVYSGQYYITKSAVKFLGDSLADRPIVRGKKLPALRADGLRGSP